MVSAEALGWLESVAVMGESNQKITLRLGHRVIDLVVETQSRASRRAKETLTRCDHLLFIMLVWLNN